ncbi:MAG: hypothetical protein ABFD08_02605 [Syntrophomonas sp.]
MKTWEEERRKVWAIVVDLKKRTKALEEKLRYIETEQPAGPERSAGPLFGEGLTDRLVTSQDGK